ncbi:hypothetical protein LEP48_10640 [Isoptericola sp. NEAU-Y5]|uniref:Uncharacterized protein n=1 Tax=Isoptericola luteus TaxID=2879484 RepID=A0ABS7ZFK3_9MICO|nr:hypothetical protein [Isoptericola sp. NEAU-Y5]MCA5893804.1 hypothetical protein [Isoptericola sp. NEAU-Y5]
MGSESDRWETLDGGVYLDLADPDTTRYRVVLSFVSEQGEGQHPLEDVLDRYSLDVHRFVTPPPSHSEPGARVVLELGGDLEDVRRAAELVGKRVRNEPYTHDGRDLVRLVIE